MIGALVAGGFPHDRIERIGHLKLEFGICDLGINDETSGEILVRRIEVKGHFMSYTDKDLEAFLDDLESDLTERKESWKGDAPQKGRQAICAFANDLPDHRRDGVLYCGGER